MLTDQSTLLADAERGQRKRLLKQFLIVGSTSVVIILVVFLLTEFDLSQLLYLAGYLFLLASAGISGLFLRADKLNLATHTILIAIGVVLFILIYLAGVQVRAIMALLLPMLIASLLLPKTSTLIYSGVTALAYTIMVLNPAIGQTGQNKIASIVMGVGIIAVIGFIASASAGRLHDLLDLARQQTTNVENLQHELEQRVRERTASLKAALDEVKTSSETIRQLNVPLLRIANGVLLLPLLGTISDTRARQIEQEMIAQAYRERPYAVLLDLTGVSDVTAMFTQRLNQITISLHLLGIKTILLGIHAAMAQAITEQSTFMPNVIIKRDVQQGLDFAKRHIA